MTSKTAIAAIAATLALCLPAKAIVYNVNDAAGGLSITGTITTDGTLGFLQQQNITDWALTITHGSDFVLLNSGNSVERLLPSGLDFLSATSSELDFDYSFLNNTNVFLNFSRSNFGGVVWNAFGNGTGGSLHLAIIGPGCAPVCVEDDARSGTQPIAYAAVPGPVVGAGLPGLLLAALGIFGWRRRKAVATA